jgi:peptidoglycan/LPS O-acetylase OafA/YrhL
MNSLPVTETVLPPINTKLEKVFFPNLDGLRFIAFLLVFLQHSLGDELAVNPQGGLLQRCAWLLLHAGSIGVSFFFVLSGFLITYLILREIALQGKLDVIAFYIRRALRIWPLYYVVISFGFLIYPLIKALTGKLPNVETGNFLAYFFFLGNFDLINAGGRGAVSTNIAWSIAVEEQFYFCWPLLFFLVRPRHYKFIFLTVLALSAWFRLAHADNDDILYFHTFSAISDMAMGGLMAYLSINTTALKVAFAKLNRLAIGVVYLIGISWLLQQDVLLGQGTLRFALLSRFVSAAFFAFIILEQNYATHSLFKVKDLSLISRFGKYTYGLYLLHPIAILGTVVIKKLLHFHSASTAVAFLSSTVSLALSLLLSAVSYHLFEKHFLNLKERFSYITTGIVTQPVQVAGASRLN